MREPPNAAAWNAIEEVTRLENAIRSSVVAAVAVAMIILPQILLYEEFFFLFLPSVVYSKFLCRFCVCSKRIGLLCVDLFSSLQTTIASQRERERERERSIRKIDRLMTTL